MRLSLAQPVSFVLALALAVSLSGCVANMPELKERLGFEDEVVPAAYVPPPALEPPVARAKANATSVLAGHPVKFISDGTRDPRGLALTYVWDFGDSRTGKGPVAVHTYEKPGEYVVRLRVVNTDGLADEDTVPVAVALGNRAPVASFQLLDPTGEPVAAATCGDKLVLDAAGSRDPDGQPLSYQWDLGDGTTPHEARVTHAYERPGVYTIKLTVTDPAGERAQASRVVRVGCAYETSGTLAPTDAATSFAFPVAPGAASVAMTLTFPAGMGLVDLQLVVKDAKGDEAARSSGAPTPGSQDAQTRTVALDATQLAALAPGEWTVEVVKKQGLQSEWSLSVRELV